MEDIIRQIVQIDSVALDTKKSNEEALRLKKEQYEKEIITYKESTLKKAQERAKEIYDQIVAVGISGHDLEEEKCKKAALAVENRYLQIEEQLLQEVFEELFRVEG